MIRVKDSRLCRYLWSGLDLINYDVLEIHPQDRRFAAIIMHDIREDAYTRKPWCVEFKGSGHYFYTRKELDEYCRGRGWY